LESAQRIIKNNYQAIQDKKNDKKGCPTANLQL